MTDQKAEFSIASERADRRWSRALRWGMVAAVVVHLIILLLTRSARLIPDSPFAAAGPNAGDVRAAAGGGSGLTMVEVREQRAQPEEVTPEPVPVPSEVVVEPVPPKPEPARDPAPATTPTQRGTGAPGAGGESGERADAGPGTATGTGRGGGGTEEEGRASAVVPPVPRGMILPPPDRPRSARGQEITVWVFVTERGRVAADSTRLEPPTQDARYNQRLMRSAAEWVFEPARRDGRPVGAWYPFQIIL